MKRDNRDVEFFQRELAFFYFFLMYFCLLKKLLAAPTGGRRRTFIHQRRILEQTQRPDIFRFEENLKNEGGHKQKENEPEMRLPEVECGNNKKRSCGRLAIRTRETRSSLDVWCVMNEFRWFSADDYLFASPPWPEFAVNGVLNPQIKKQENSCHLKSSKT